MMTNALNPELCPPIWRELIPPIFEALGTRTVVQIGMGTPGQLEQLITHLEHNSGEIFLIDPNVQNRELGSLLRKEHFTFWQAEPFPAIEYLPEFDTLIMMHIDHDPEVFLRLIEEHGAPSLALAFNLPQSLDQAWAKKNLRQHRYVQLAENAAVLIDSHNPDAFDVITSLVREHPIGADCATADDTQTKVINSRVDDVGGFMHRIANYMREARQYGKRLILHAKDTVRQLGNHNPTYQVAHSDPFPQKPIKEEWKTERAQIITTHEAIQRSTSCFNANEPLNSTVSVVIAHNGNSDGGSLKQIQSILTSNASKLQEIVIVGGANYGHSIRHLVESVDSTVETTITTIISDENNANRASCNNLGAKAAHGDYLLFLGEGVEITNSLVCRLLSFANSNPKCGAIGPKIIRTITYSSSTGDHRAHFVDSAGVAFKTNGIGDSECIQPYELFSGHGALDNIQDTPYVTTAVSAACLLVRKTAFEAAGGFDEGFMCALDDFDMCLNLIRKGYENYVEPTQLAFSSEGQGVPSDDDRTLFQRKWQQFLAKELLDDIDNGAEIFVKDTALVDHNLLEALCPTRQELDDHKIMIITPCDGWEQAESWGDYHFARALSKYFNRKGFETEIRITENWYEPFDGKYIIALQGLYHYVPSALHVNIMWNISHPEDLSLYEYDRYDMVFIASKIWAEHIRQLAHIPVETMLQCTDHELFVNDGTIKKNSEVLFVGNTRGGVFRKSVKWLLPTNRDLAVYGKGWNEFIDASYIKGEVIPNRLLGRVYGSCAILLNDHWDDMRELGFVSNRIFDGLAAGAFIATDSVAGYESELHAFTAVYNDRKSLRDIVEYYLTNPHEREAVVRAGKRAVLENHTFEKRVDTFVEYIESL